MALPNERIAAGLDARQRQRDSAAERRVPQPPMLLGPGARPVPRRSAEDLVRQSEAILETEREVKRLIARALDDMREAEARITEQWLGERNLPREMSAAIAREKVRERVDEIRAETRTLIDSIVRDCAGSAQALASQATMYHSRAQSLSLVGLGTRPARPWSRPPPRPGGRVCSPSGSSPWPRSSTPTPPFASTGPCCPRCSAWRWAGARRRSARSRRRRCWTR
jgi:hypothetical protein